MSGRRITAQNHHILSHESCDPRHAADCSSGLSQACLSREADKSIGQSQGLEGARHLPLRRLKTDLESTTVYGQPKLSDTACTRQDSVFVAPPEPDLAVWPTEGHDQDGGGRTRPTGPWTQYGFLQTACPEGTASFLNSAGTHAAVPRGRSLRVGNPLRTPALAAGRSPCYAWASGEGYPTPRATPATALALSHLTATAC